MTRLSIVVPVYNESAHLEDVVRTLLSAECPIEREWIFVDDCSTDGSSAILERLAREHGFRLIRHEQNMGKGSAVINGIREASGDFLMIQDADYEYDPRDVPALLEPLIRGEADVVYGSRFKKSGQQVHRTYHYLVNRTLTALSNLFSGIYLTDMETCYKAFRSDLLKAMNLGSRRFGIEVEMTAYVAKTRARIMEVPIRYYPRTRLQGKKIGWRDGVAALYFLAKYNLWVTPSQAFTNLPKPYELGWHAAETRNS
jgi:glycosyltransferase involved in cell wall biosynthesis